MPNKSGFEVCTELRQKYPETLPVIMISANTDEDNILKGFRAGSNDYVKKPFSRAEVCDIGVCLSFKEAHAQPLHLCKKDSRSDLDFSDA